jgi:hypothetical protein|tara:strand:- start:27 stop:668 length:642 start_codon:yes stop_codon:yes gene_type:complete
MPKVKSGVPKPIVALVKAAVDTEQKIVFGSQKEAEVIQKLLWNSRRAGSPAHQGRLDRISTLRKGRTLIISPKVGKEANDGLGTITAHLAKIPSAQDSGLACIEASLSKAPDRSAADGLMVHRGIRAGFGRPRVLSGQNIDPGDAILGWMTAHPGEHESDVISLFSGVRDEFETRRINEAMAFLVKAGLIKRRAQNGGSPRFSLAAKEGFHAA